MAHSLSLSIFKLSPAYMAWPMGLECLAEHPDDRGIDFLYLVAGLENRQVAAGVRVREGQCSLHPHGEGSILGKFIAGAFPAKL